MKHDFIIVQTVSTHPQKQRVKGYRLKKNILKTAFEWNF